VLQVGKREVLINAAEPVGLYGIACFPDGHTGIYSWECLYDLGVNQAALWDEYLKAWKRRRLARTRHRQDVRAVQGQVMPALQPTRPQARFFWGVPRNVRWQPPSYSDLRRPASFASPR
jgi:hypothetical protein